MSQQIPLDPSVVAPEANSDDGLHEICADVAYKRLGIVNVVYVGLRLAGDGKWVLIDAGTAASERAIVTSAADRFGGKGRPSAIVMTHGHFDHVGQLEDLAERWDVPIYAHEQEHPFLNGTSCYPPPDPSVGGGMMARLSGLFPRRPVDVSKWLRPLPADYSVPGMPGWRWIHTPGHTPGHVSFWREEDRTLIAGDAFVTTRQESVYAALTQKPEMHGPPQYYTPDWSTARESVRMLAQLEPDLVVTGHGRAMHGAEMRAALHELADRFDEIAVPK
jgi:glyoxylase-like metal-dependent hydrolase (beta-lactamase superfamily II)